MRKVSKFAGMGCGLLLLLAIGLLGWTHHELRPQPPDSALPALARNLPAEFALGDAEFRRRVVARFPLGTPQAELVSVLKTQGFHFRNTLASFNQRRFPCRLFWVIFWHADAAGRIERLETNYSPGCL